MSETDGVSVSRLIALVRERPVLWDRQEEVYKNRKLTKKAWAEICEELLDNYSELPEEDQKAFARSVIGKWANLRDNWLRYWRKRQDYLRIGSCNSKFKKYVHHEQLMFLSKVYDDQSEMEIQQEVEEIQVEVDVLSDPGTESLQGFSSEEVSQTPWNLGVGSEDNGLTQRNTWVPEEKPPPPLLPLAEERHLYFFQSTLPLIADFDESQVLDFHAAVLESIKRVKTGKSVVNIVPTPQPAYILAIAPPQGFLTSTAEVKPKELPESNNNSKQSSIASGETTAKKDSVSNCFVNVSSSNPQNPSSTKSAVDEDKPKQDGTNAAQKSSTKRQPLADLELTDLKSVVIKLNEISQKFESPLFEDTHDKFGKYIGSFLRTLPLKKARLLKRRIVRQVLRVQMSDKINSTHCNKLEETIDKNKSLNSDTCLKPQRTSEQRSVSLEETVRINSPLRNLHLSVRSEMHSKIQGDGIPTNPTKSNGNPVEDCQTSRFTCHVCSCVCVSSAELHSHCSSQHKGYSPSFKSKAEPAKRGRRGRKKKIFNNAEVIS